MLLLVLLLYGLLHFSPVQTWVVNKVAKNLSAQLQTKVTVKRVDFRFFNKIMLEGVMVEDRKQDTLLYAGTVSASVNDWFFFKDKISVENVGLENAIINMNRTDSVWNYQFIIDHFASPKTQNAKENNINIDFREVHFTNIRFNKIDGWIGQDLKASLKQLDVVVDLLDLKNKKLKIGSVFLGEPIFAQRDYEGKRPAPANITPVLEKIPVISAFKWNNSGWEVYLDKLEIQNGSFRNDKRTPELPDAGRFDGTHLYFTQINGSMKQLSFVHDTLKMQVLLATTERSGFKVNKLSAAMRVTPEMMEFRNLDLITPKSRLRDYYAMRFNSFQDDFGSFINNVTLVANFKESLLNSDDLAFFAPALKTWKRNFYLEGSVEGPLDNFSAKNMTIRTGNSILQGRIAMRGLPDIHSTFIDFESPGFKTNYQDLVALVPQLRKITKPAISKLGNVYFKGNFTGFIRDFVAFGTFNTNLGTIAADINMKTPESGVAAYSGKLITENFDVGTSIGTPLLGRVSLNTGLTGRGFSVADLRLRTDGEISAMQFKGYNYRNIKLNGSFEKKLFMGHLSIDDPNLKIPSLDGAFNLSAEDVGFRLQARIAFADLANLGLSAGNLKLRGDADLDFTGNDIDNFLGTARIYNAQLLNDSLNLSFDSLTVRSEIIGGKKSLTLRTNEVDANITGDFKIAELPDAVKLMLAKYYPAYIEAPVRPLTGIQNFTFEIATKNADQYIGLLHPKLSGFNNSVFNGTFNLADYQLKLNANVPLFAYNGKSFVNTRINASGGRDSLVAEALVDDVIINDSLHLPNSALRIAASNDVSVIRLNTSASKIFGDAELNASVETSADGVRISFYPSSFVINNKLWKLEENGQLTLRKNYIDASEVKFSSGESRIVLSTELDEETDDTHLTARLTKVDAKDFMPFVLKQPKIEGILTGTLTVKNIFGKSAIDFKGRADSFALDGKYIGNLDIDADVNTKTGIVRYDVKADGAENKFGLTGTYDLNDTTGRALNLNFNARSLNIDLLQPYLSTVFSEIRGIAEGNINIRGGADNQEITGDAIINNGVFKVAYTQVKYLFDRQPIKFGKGFIDLGTMQIRDTLNNRGTVSGKMYHNFFKDFSFENMRFQTEKMLLLNTQKKDNPQFYGHVTGRALMTLNGGITNMRMNIDGAPDTDDSSHIYLPTGNSREANAIDYIEFIRFGSEMQDDGKLRTAANLLVNMNLSANPACKIDVILNEETGDIIKGQGAGDLNIRVGTKEPLSIRGRYDLTGGEYVFNFQTFLRKPFTLRTGSITWSGDPFLAVIDMEAEYLAKNVDISQLTFSGSTGVRQPQDITILSRLTGSLKTPVISFEFLLPPTSEVNRDFYVVKRLAEYKNDENEMNKQVASLLLFNQFVNNNQTFLSAGSTLTIATSTIGGVVSGWLTNLFNKELEKATKGFLSTYIDINPSVNFQQANQLQANIRAGLQVRILSNVILLIGGAIDYNSPLAQLYRSNSITPDLSVEWLLNKEGTIRVVAFSRNSIDFATGQRRRSGIRLSYRKDIDRLGDIFRSRKKIAAGTQ